MSVDPPFPAPEVPRPAPTLPPFQYVPPAPPPPFGSPIPPTPAWANSTKWPRPQRSGLAVAALTCGIVGIPLFFVGILGVLAVIFGLVSARQIKASGGQLSGLGLARAGWILGSIGVAFFGLMMWAAMTGRLDEETGNSPFDRQDPTQIDVGECLEELPRELVTSFARVNCSLPHLGEVYHVGDLSERGNTGSEFPGQDEIEALTYGMCLEEFDDFVGIPYLESQYDLASVSPRLGSWQFGQRDGVCIVISAEPTVGSLEGVAE